MPASLIKVLVIDDEIPVLRLIKDVLYKNGYDATVFADPTQFNDFYKQNWKKIDLVIADTIMPSVDAASFIKNLTSLNPQIKIIALTGLSAAEVEDANIMLKKPIEPSQLLSSLKELFP
jgi:DNA-binding NtrC family response regulator